MEEKLPITCKLLISIDRGNTARNYLENICLAQWYRRKYPEIVVGLDLSGDPNKGDTKKIMFALNFSKKMGQRLSLHLPEVRFHSISSICLYLSTLLLIMRVFVR